MRRDSTDHTGRSATPFAILAAGALCAWLACGGAAVPRSEAVAASGQAVERQAPATSASSSADRAPPTSSLVPERYADAARYSEAHGGHALLVLEDTRMVVETGQNGHPHDVPHPLYGATKSFWGVLAAAAVQDGVLEIDENVTETLPEFQSDDWKRSLRVHHLLDFTSGLESGVRELRRDPALDRYARALELEMVAAPGERFQYGPAHLFVFGVLLQRKRPDGLSDPLAYLTRRIFDPIGLQVADWSRDERGNPDLSTGAVLRAREWAKFGMLVRDRGRWRGRPVVDPEPLAACFLGSDAQPRFGLTFWLNVPGGSGARRARSPVADAGDADLFFPGGPEDLVVAAGSGNQRLYVIPSAELVAVRFGEPDREWRDAEFLARLMAGSAARPQAPAGAADQADRATRRAEPEPRDPAGSAAYP